MESHEDPLPACSEDPILGSRARLVTTLELHLYRNLCPSHPLHSSLTSESSPWPSNVGFYLRITKLDERAPDLNSVISKGTA